MTFTIYVLLVAHFAADFLAQSDWMAINKSKRWDALAWHVLVYFNVLGVIVAFSQPASEYPYTTLWQFGYFIVANAAAHFVQDAITSRITSRLWFFRFMLAGKKWRELDRDADGRGGVSAEQEAFYIDDLGTRHWFFVMIGFDQLLHYATLFVTAGWWLQ